MLHLTSHHSPGALFLMPFLLFGTIQCLPLVSVSFPFQTVAPGRSNFVSFSPNIARRGRRLGRQYYQQTYPIFHRTDGTMKHSISDEHEDGNTQSLSENADIDISNVNEAQVLLACRAYLLRKHKVEWKGKKRRAQAAASPTNNEGYFWPDPNDLLYLREDPDPYNLIYNETYAEYYGYKRNGVRFLTSQDTTYSGKNYLIDESVEPENERASTSANPFSTNPLYPPDEHVRRSNAKKRLWNNETWVEEWYNRRWAGKVATENQKKLEKEEKLLHEIPNDVLESPSFDSMTEEEVTEAIITYLAANQRKSESRKSNKDKRQIERESFREWREQVKQEAHNSHMLDQNITTRDVSRKVVPPSKDDALSFSPSVETMEKLRAQRSEKSRKAFQTRLANSKTNVSSSSKKKMTELRQSYNQKTNYTDNDDASLDLEPEGETSPVQALLQIDMALDNNKIPSPSDVETILKPGRLGRRRDTLRRILSECFALRGKCVPALTGDSDFRFVTTCTIEELGVFVLGKLRQNLAHYDGFSP
mmetsp:Transcript_5717/g.12454  ORF Transcript_5717/g.12454 Transcript_5717/m.12454 type:complete len:533 (-) Transcript_5717:307-1905(-)